MLAGCLCVYELTSTLTLGTVIDTPTERTKELDMTNAHDAQDDTTVTVAGYDAVIDLLTSAVRMESTVTREEYGYCCDAGPYEREYASDPVDLLCALAIYRHANDDHQVSMEYYTDRFGERIDTGTGDVCAVVKIESGLTGGEYSATEYRLTH